VRFPLAPLERLARNGDAEMTTITLASALGVDRRTIHKWRRTGLSEWQADRAAITLGVHPGTVWAEWWQV